MMSVFWFAMTVFAGLLIGWILGRTALVRDCRGQGRFYHGGRTYHCREVEYSERP